MDKFARTVIVTLVCCILVLFLKNQYSSMLLINASYGMPALINQGEVENLYLGSSMFRQGLDIMILENAMPEKNYILAYNGNQPVLEFYQLGHLLENNVKIEHLYIDMYVYSAWAEPEISDEKLFLEIGLKEKWGLWNLIRNEAKTNFESFFRMFVSSNNELLLTWPFNNKLINGQFYRGGALNHTSGVNADVLNNKTVPEIGLTMNETQEYYLRQIIQLARNHNISVIFIETPKHSVIASNVSYLSAMKAYIQLANMENVSCIISENTARSLENYAFVSKCYTFDHENADYYMDSVHLSYNGRAEFTKNMIDLITEKN